MHTYAVELYNNCRLLCSEIMNTFSFKMATQAEDDSKTGEKEYEREEDKGESDACYIDQTVR